MKNKKDYGVPLHFITGRSAATIRIAKQAYCITCGGLLTLRLLSKQYTIALHLLITAYALTR